MAPSTLSEIGNPKYSEGQWFRFYRNGVLVIGSVYYIRKTVLGHVEYCTDVGTVIEDHVLEAR